MASRRTAALALAALVAVPGLSGCGNGGKKQGSPAAQVTVMATDSTCVLDRTALAAGQTTFAISNKGSKTTEVYIYGGAGDTFTKVISEQENIGPGTTRDLKVDLAAGSYEVACKPGQTGDGIRTKITVGDGTAAAPPATTYDRELELATDGKAITGGAAGAKVGEKIEFKLTNNASGPRVLEIKDPSGAAAGETEKIAPDAVGEVVLMLSTAGTWKLIVEGEGVADVTADLTVA